MVNDILLALNARRIGADLFTFNRDDFDLIRRYLATITVGSHTVVFIGRPTSTSPVACAPGTPNPQTVVAVEPGGGSAAQITGVLAFHDHEVSLGSRYEITGGPTTCNTDFKLYTGTLD